MKQNITYKQIEELNTNNIIKLYKQSNLKLKDIDNGIDWFTQYKCDLSEYFTIGKMIEILSKNTVSFEIIELKKDNIWNIHCIIPNKVLDYEEKELCDALWQAVKYIIN